MNQQVQQKCEHKGHVQEYYKALAIIDKSYNELKGFGQNKE